MIDHTEIKLTGNIPLNSTLAILNQEGVLIIKKVNSKKDLMLIIPKEHCFSSLTLRIRKPKWLPYELTWTTNSETERYLINIDMKKDLNYQTVKNV